MSQKTYDWLIFIGRFQPFHNGHKAVIDQALKQAKNVLVLVGSANRHRSIRNPFTFKERQDMIRSVYPIGLGEAGKQNEGRRLVLAPLDDHTYNEEEWIEQVQAIVKDHTWDTTIEGTTKIGLIGRNKDNTSYYLKLFPQWGSVSANDPELKTLNATDIRNALFQTIEKRDIHRFQEKEFSDVPPEARIKLMEFSPHILNEIAEEHKWCENYKKPWANTPYPVTFNTVDSVVIQSGHILLVERKARPGKGLLALPGGFLNQDETMLQGAIRELREETRLDVPKGVLYGSMKGSRTFDDIHRDPRGRFITQAFLFHFPPGPLPKVKAGSDAKKAEWVPLIDIDPTKLFIDHAFIIKTMTAYCN